MLDEDAKRTDVQMEQEEIAQDVRIITEYNVHEMSSVP